MRAFLSYVNEMIGQINLLGKYETNTVQSMADSYRKLSMEEKAESLKLLADLLKEDYRAYFYLMSTLMVELQEDLAVCYIEKMLCSKNVPLWERIGGMYQLQGRLFRMPPFENKVNGHKRKLEVYHSILQEIKGMISWNGMKHPWALRKKTVIIVMSQILTISHAPTRKMESIYRYFTELGYEVRVYLCFHPGKTDTEHIFWYEPLGWRNLVTETGYFTLAKQKPQDEKTQIFGYNLRLSPDSYLLELKKAVGLIYDQQPEFVLVLGEETILAGLCQDFTTVVTMGCTKMAPITNTPIIARYFYYSPEEDQIFQECLEEGQIVMDVMHDNIGELRFFDKNEGKRAYRQKLNIPDEVFFILIYGNRLDDDVTDTFQEILGHIVKLSRKIRIAFLGKCEKLQRKMENTDYKSQTIFFGFRRDYSEVIAAADLFLNPPRQGSGTGATWASMAGVPVITLDDCDVESEAGKEFVCETVEEMPSLVWKYFTDNAFYERQSSLIMEKAQKNRNIDSLENFQGFCRQIQDFTMAMEKGAAHEG